MNIKDVGGDKTWRDAVDATKVNPFHGQAFGQLNNTSLGCIVLLSLVSQSTTLVTRDSTYRSLFLGHIDQSRTDGSRENDISMALLLKHTRRRLCRIESTVQIDLHDLTPLFGRIVLGRDRRHDAGVGDQNIQLAKVLYHLLDSRLDRSLARHIGLVCSGTHIVGGCDLCRGRFGCFGRVIDQSHLRHWWSEQSAERSGWEKYVGTSFCHCSRHLETDTARTTWVE